MKTTVLTTAILGACAAFSAASAGITDEVSKWDPRMAAEKAVVDTNGVKWIDGRYLPIEGRMFDDVEHYYDRLPSNVTANVNGGVRSMKHHTAGMQFRFVTDSKRLTFKWVPWSERLTGDNMAQIGASGIDVYRQDKDGRWWFVRVGRIMSAKGAEFTMGWTPGTPCLVNLPLYNGVRSFTLGIDKDATVRALGSRRSGVEKPVVFYGTSITHGASASRPGLSWVNQIGRDLDVPVVNLGFSGCGRMEYEMSEHLARIDASCYVLDCLWNMNCCRGAPDAQDEADVRAAGCGNNSFTRENMLIYFRVRYEPFIRNLRRLRPDTPIVMAEQCDVFSKNPSEKDRFIRALYEKLVAEGWKKLVYLPKTDMYNGDLEGTIDGCHPNDWGCHTMALAFGKAVREALGLSAGGVKASDFGWNAEDATECLQKAIDSKAPVVIVDRQQGPWIVRPIKCASDQKIVFEPGVEVQAKRGEFKGVGDSLININNRKNVTLSGKGARLRMWKSDYQNPPYKPGEHRMNVMVMNSSDVTIEGLEIVESGGDGIYIGGSKEGKSRNIVIRDVVCDGHHRQGISVTSVDGLLIENSVFRNTDGTAPTAGIDFEPYSQKQALKGIVLRNCLFENNRCAGIEFACQSLDCGSEPMDCLVENCRSVGNGTACKFTINTKSGKEVLGSCVFRNCEFDAKDRGGVFALLKNRKNSCELKFENCRVRAKGQAEFHVLTEKEWQAQVGSTVHIGGELDVPLIKDPDYSGLEVVDTKPGELVPVSPFEYRFSAGFVFYADRAKDVRFKMKIRTLSPKHAVPVEPVVVTDLKGREIATIEIPKGGFEIVSCRVPEAGFYQMKPKSLGAYGLFALAATDVPIAKVKGGFWYATGDLWFHVSDPKEPMLFSAVGGGAGENIWLKIFEPDGRKFFEKASIGVNHRIAFDVPRPVGLWHATLGKPDSGRFEDSGVSLWGVPNWMFLSKEKYWKRKSGGAQDAR